MDSRSSFHGSQSTDLQGSLQLEKPELSYADLPSEVVKDVENIPSESSENRQKKCSKGKAIQNEELVKYMSELPSYLERGENLKEKALNVGVLDWCRLEKWQYNRKPMSYQSSSCSPSNSNASSSFLTDESSVHSSRGRSSSPAQRMQRMAQQCHINASPRENLSRCCKTSVEHVGGKFQDFEPASNGPLKGQQSIFPIYQSSSKSQSEIELKESRRKDAGPKIIPKIGVSLDLKNDRAATWAKGKTNIQNGKSSSRLEKLQEPQSAIHHTYGERCKTVVLPPRDYPESSCSTSSCPCDVATVNGRGSTEARRRRFSDGSFPKELFNADSYSDIPQLHPLPCEDDDMKNSQIKQPSSVDEKSVKISSEPSQTSCSVKMSISPLRGRKLEKKSKVMPRNSIAIKSSEGSELKMGTVEVSKVRNPSPTRRLSIGLGRIGRNATSKGSSEHYKAKCEPEKVMASTCLNDSNSDKPSGTNRSQSSPLRRILDQFLKPKAANSHHSVEPSEKDLTPADRVCKPSNRRVESSTVKMKLDLTSCKTINVDNSHQKRHGSTTMQALVQIAIKNGLPLFTFAVDNNSDILVATMKKVSTSRKDENCWIYTFFAVHEVKKSNGWINQGSKGKSRGYVPNVVAQMTVSDCQNSSLLTQNSVDELGSRKFVLFAVDLRQADQQASDCQPNDEVAAIVVKFPKENGHHNDNISDKLATSLRKSPPEVNSYARSGESEENGSPVQSEELRATVILPGGIHGQPRKGEPSSLIDRWKSGGLCDCGGWDMGCRIRVLANHMKPSRISSSHKTHGDACRFELFDQGEVPDDRPVFNLSPFKDRIFSVEFNSSLSFLQAFSICIAVINSRKPYELSGLGTLFEEKYPEEATSVINDVIKNPC
ncbi:uncharacterized protein LOC127797858 [Diospyros lotus]|uniref:uncharacterized protein LOC127797858 n=1 Tax=Diospyros lotus TaxID=55363 RepID=UPI0022579702|nr:uncharacterized protein LOC127797858 [Diospyros lotus]XP_052186980.1 uncharacterized protein LOC127797858 [Diospyros lotus]XP_052186981.1 uncharacterized protein LOC127797858 [Diospyros lotus]